jgi:Sodium/hydrogen exchanger family
MCHDRRVGARCAVARSRAGREPTFDLVPDFDGPFRNSRRNHRPAHHRCRGRFGDPRNRRVWIKFLSGIGAIILTFLAGAELDPIVFRLKWKEAGAVGLANFLLPFLVCAAAAHYLLGWDIMPSWLAGVAMSTTSVAVVYAVMLEFGFNVTEYGKTILAACFVTDLGTVVALGMIFAPFTIKTLVFVVSMYERMVGSRARSDYPARSMSGAGCEMTPYS